MNLKNGLRGKLIISISLIVVVALSALWFSPVTSNSDLVQTSNSHVVNGYSPNFEAATFTTQNQSGTENSIATLFLNWLQSNGQAQGIQNTNASIALFQEFVSQNQTAEMYLQILTSEEQNNYSNAQSAQQSLQLKEQVVYSGTPINEINTSTVTSQGTFHDHSVLYEANFNGTQYEVWAVNVTTPTGSVIDPWVWVNINYYVYHAPWYLGGWSLTYGENDNYNVEFTGSAAQSFFNNWESTTTYAGYGLAAAGLVALFIPVPVLAQAIGAALIIVGVGLLYEASTMLSYYESTGFSYIHLDFVNDYFYPWITLVGTFASSVGLYGLNSNGNSYTFWYNVPFVAYGGIMGVTFSAEVSSVNNQFVSDYGSGNWVWFS
ncbi:MAG: hypothetical protein B2I18_02080 [Cuniculiplasma sp. C_DKE]|jgi:hypothetical protein|nr:MAG: hypothetical protein B2I18_02080 [Cuniculiplasma sp. C_DKE]